MTAQFYLQDSRTHVGDGLSFWAKEGKGYYTDLDKCELYTKEQATRHRDTDIPWPKQYIDERAHYGVDCQLMDEDASNAMLKPGCRVYVHVPGDWNGNDVYWVGFFPGNVTADLGRAANIQLEKAQETFADGIASERYKLWSAGYIDTIRRRLVHRQDVDIRKALRGTGIKLTKPKKQSRSSIQNCGGCGRFVSSPVYSDCRHCGAENHP